MTLFQNGWTALHWAVDRGHKDVARVLMKWGIDPLIEGRVRYLVMINRVMLVLMHTST